MQQLTAETLQVHILDFTAANKKVTEALNPNSESSYKAKYYFGAKHCALVDINNRFFLVGPEVIFILKVLMYIFL